MRTQLQEQEARDQSAKQQKQQLYQQQLLQQQQLQTAAKSIPSSHMIIASSSLPSTQVKSCYSKLE